jgi:hypothetical protein
VHCSRCERPVAIGQSVKVAGGKGGQVGACQSGLDKGVGGEVFSGESLEPASEVKRQIAHHPEPQRVFGVWSAGVYEKACAQGSCIRGGALSGWHRVRFYPKVGLAGCPHAMPYRHEHRPARTRQARYI